MEIVWFKSQLTFHVAIPPLGCSHKTCKHENTCDEQSLAWNFMDEFRVVEILYVIIGLAATACCTLIANLSVVILHL